MKLLLMKFLMTEQVKIQFDLVSGLVSEIRRLGSLPAIEEGLLKVEEFLKNTERLSETVPEEQLLESLRFTDEIARRLVRLARKEKGEEEQKKKAWRFTGTRKS